jgi:putative endonuclease
LTYFLYILRSTKSQKFYIGSSFDIAKRLEQHNSGKSRSTKGGSPSELVYSESFVTRAEALSQEKEIKRKKSRKYIERLIESENSGDSNI